jgi:hypothetical protein
VKGALKALPFFLRLPAISKRHPVISVVIQALAIFRETGIISVPLLRGGPVPQFIVRVFRSAFAVTFIQLVSVVLVFPCGLIHAQNAAPAPNSDPTYQSLRNLTLSGESVSVSNVKLKREAGTFHLRSGSVCFVAAVNGKVTGAVFTPKVFAPSMSAH